MSTEGDIFSAFGADDEAPPEPRRRLPAIPGRVSPAPYSLQKLAKEYTEEAFDTIREIMLDLENDASTRLEAAKQILDRGWGKAAVKIQAETIQYTLQDVQDKLLEHKAEIDARVDEARRIERERIERYLATDVEVVEDASTRSESALQDN